MTWKKVWFLSIICGAIIGGGIQYKIDHRSVVIASSPACVAGPGELCPNADFLSDYHRFQDRVHQLLILQSDSKAPAREIVDLRDMMTGQASRMQGEFPIGYTFDEQKLKFITRIAQPPPAPIPPQATTPSQPAKTN